MSGNAQPQSSQLAEPLWTDPGLKNGISVSDLIFKKKKKKKIKAQTGNELLNILLKILAREVKATIMNSYTLRSHLYLLLVKYKHIFKKKMFYLFLRHAKACRSESLLWMCERTLLQNTTAFKSAQ